MFKTTVGIRRGPIRLRVVLQFVTVRSHEIPHQARLRRCGCCPIGLVDACQTIIRVHVYSLVSSSIELRVRVQAVYTCMASPPCPVDSTG